MDQPTLQGFQRTILQEADSIIHGARKTDYGEVTPSFKRIAQLASIFIGKDLDKFDICWIMIALKISRQMNQPKRDNLVDLAGYVGLMQQLLDEEENPKIAQKYSFHPVPSDPFKVKEKSSIDTDYDAALKRYLDDRKLSQPNTGVCNDYRENAQAQGWVKNEL